MSKKKDYPPASRQSARLHSETAAQTVPPQNPEAQIAPHAESITVAGDSSLSADHRDSEELDNVATIISTEPEAGQGQKMGDNRQSAAASGISAAEAQELRDMIATLQAQLANGGGSRQTREATPADSVFGGTQFVPTGQAANPAFRPYGPTASSANPHYNYKAKERGVTPKTFKGDKKTFDLWVKTVANKFEEDDETFRTEKSRMNKLTEYLEGGPLEVLQPRLLSDDNPFSSVAEMVQVLNATYHDPNQASAVRAKLAKLKYDPAKDTDIHVFLASFNNLAQTANVAVADMKMTLWEYIPPNLDYRLLTDAQNPDISYEVFSKNVANAAYSQKRHYEETRERRAGQRGNRNRPKSENNSPPRGKA